MENGRHTNDPTKDIGEVPTPDLARQGISDAAINALLRATAGEPDHLQRQRDQADLALLVYAGLRIQETCHLKIRDLDLESVPGNIGPAQRLPGGRVTRSPLIWIC
jgi:integrase